MSVQTDLVWIWERALCSQVCVSLWPRSLYVCMAQSRWQDGLSTVIWTLMQVLLRNRHRAPQRNSVTSNLSRCILFRPFRRNSVVALFICGSFGRSLSPLSFRTITPLPGMGTEPPFYWHLHNSIREDFIVVNTVLVHHTAVTPLLTNGCESLSNIMCF